MKKYLVILIVLVIGLVAFQGLVGWNQKQEMLANIILPGETVNIEVTTEPTEFITIQNEISEGYVRPGYILKPNKTVLGITLPNYSELSAVEIVVNIGFILGIVFCLIKIRTLYKLENEDEDECEDIEILDLLEEIIMLRKQLNYMHFMLFLIYISVLFTGL